MKGIRIDVPADMAGKGLGRKLFLHRLLNAKQQGKSELQFTDDSITNSKKGYLWSNILGLKTYGNKNVGGINQKIPLDHAISAFRKRIKK